MKEEKVVESSKKKLVAKKDWHLFQNKIDISIKKGDDVSKFKLRTDLLAALKTENVI